MSDSDFKTNIILGDPLKDFVSDVSLLEKRDCFSRITCFLESSITNRVCILYGLRRTGKTTMMKQAILDSPIEKCAYIKTAPSDTIDNFNHDLKLLYNRGIKNVFIDEVTSMEDFIDTASIFSDIFAPLGLKIVLSGTDSLSFWLAEGEELYDRTVMVHTTFIPFHEHSRLLKTDSLDEYIQYGGTLYKGQSNLEDKTASAGEVCFQDDESARRYTETAICNNILNSLSFYENGGHFRHLRSLYLAGKLTDAINRVIENENYEFVASILNESDAAALRLQEILNTRNTENQTIGITDTHIFEIKQYLTPLDLIVELPVKTETADFKPFYNTVFTQPGLRYSRVKALIYSLDPQFVSASERDKDIVTERILTEVLERMTEDIVRLETTIYLKNKYNVFKFQFTRGELDMVIYNPEADNCRIYEIKHSDKADENQYRNLVDEDKCKLIEARFGRITNRIVLYNGDNLPINEAGVEYRNISEYLRELP